MLFRSVRDRKGDITRYDFYLLNNTNNAFSYDYAFYVDGDRHHQTKGKIDAGGSIRLNEFKTDYLNDGPVCQFTLNKWTAGEREHIAIEKEIRIKTKQFFTKIQSQEFLKDGYFLMEVWNDFLPKKTDWPQAPETAFDFDRKHLVRHNEVELKAALPDFIDLHIETLMPGTRFSDKGEILLHQLRHFRNFLEQAIRFNLHRIYAVHGLGKGNIDSLIREGVVAESVI